MGFTKVLAAVATAMLVSPMVAQAFTYSVTASHAQQLPMDNFEIVVRDHNGYDPVFPSVRLPQGLGWSFENVSGGEPGVAIARFYGGTPIPSGGAYVFGFDNDDYEGMTQVQEVYWTLGEVQFKLAQPAVETRYDADAFIATVKLKNNDDAMTIVMNAVKYKVVFEPEILENLDYDHHPQETFTYMGTMPAIIEHGQSIEFTATVDPGAYLMLYFQGVFPIGNRDYCTVPFIAHLQLRTDEMVTTAADTWSEVKTLYE